MITDVFSRSERLCKQHQLLGRRKSFGTLIGLLWIVLAFMKPAYHSSTISSAKDSRLLFMSYPIVNGTLMTAFPAFSVPIHPLPSSQSPNFGSVAYIPLGSAVMKQQYSQARRISNSDETIYHNYRAQLLQEMDNQTIALFRDQKQAAWNDYSRYEHYDEIDWRQSQADNKTSCQRPKWSFETRLNCNSLHEVSLAQLSPTKMQKYTTKYLSEGSFRMAWLLQDTTKLSSKAAAATYKHPITETRDTLVMKNLRLALEWNALTMKQVHLEALVMLQTLDSSATADIYGHCGTSVLVETGQSIRNSVFYSQVFVPLKHVERQQRVWNTTSLNQLTDEQRLKLALRMAESLAAMHGRCRCD
jgi:hypothetical protein